MRIPLSSISASLVAVTVALTGCGSADEVADRGACPVDPVRVVVSVDQWGDIVERLGGDCADVTTVITGSSADPHDYEPTPGDLASFERADLVVVNGLDYDHWAVDAADAAGDGVTVVDAGKVVGLAEGDNPHIWYSPDHVTAVATAVTEALSAEAPDAATYFLNRQGQWRRSMQAYTALVASLRTTASGRTYAATEPVFDDMAQALGLTDATPAGYRSAAANESEPSPGDLADFEAAIEAGDVDVLVYNTQTEGPGPERLRKVAEEHGTPVVDVTESMPDGAGGFAQWQVAQLVALADALAP